MTDRVSELASVPRNPNFSTKCASETRKLKFRDKNVREMCFATKYGLCPRGRRLCLRGRHLYLRKRHLCLRKRHLCLRKRHMCLRKRPTSKFKVFHVQYTKFVPRSMLLCLGTRFPGSNTFRHPGIW